MHQIADIISIFEDTFLESHNTRLVRGEDEPVYLPADGVHTHHRVVFAHGYYASALHETAHWLVAGEARRQLEDYGYWYCPDGRNKAQQQAFEQVEVLPQAIEWALCTAAGFPFNVSADNLGGEQTCRFSFQQRVHAKVLSLLDSGFNERTRQLLRALSDFYGTPWPLQASHFCWQAEKELFDAV